MLGGDGCQCGHGLAGFEGVRYQKGFGLLSSLFSKVLPYLKKFGSYIGKHLLNYGTDVASDVVLDGKPIKESAKRRLKETASKVTTDGMEKLQSLLQNGRGIKRQIGLGKKKKKSVKKMKTTPRVSKRKKTCRKLKRKVNKSRKRSVPSTTPSFLI